MNVDRFAAITGRYPTLRVAVVGDFFLDRYLLIDPAQDETSIETGLPVHAVSEVRPQPGAAGTIVNNLVALGVGTIHVVGFRGDDGEGYELHRELGRLAGVNLEHFLVDPSRRTPTYCKPTVIEPGKPPRELSRLDSKNVTPTPESLSLELARRLLDLMGQVGAVIVMDQVDRPGTGVATPPVLESAWQLGDDGTLVLADSRQGLGHYPPLGFKMNASELARMAVGSAEPIEAQASRLAERNVRPVFVTMAELGILGAEPGLPVEHVPSHPVRGPIDVVGAGDSVTANLAAAMASGATAREAMVLAMAAASVVVHKLGTTGTATVEEIARLLQVTTQDLGSDDPTSV